jgi:ABC-2 type transport system ATP-binding protein
VHQLISNPALYITRLWYHCIPSCSNHRFSITLFTVTKTNSMDNSFVVKTTGLSYRYAKDENALTGINLAVERGSIYGFLGPNGSGKTTTLSLLLGLLKNQEGSIDIFGQSLKENRKGILQKTGSLVESPSLYGHLTATQNLEIYRETYGVSRQRAAAVLEMMALADTGKKAVKQFSLGMKQRLAIAIALLPNPELLVLDEPTNGLDPAGIIELRQLIKKLNKEQGMTILISSHLLAEVEKTVTHVGIIYKGRMLFQGSMQELHAFQQHTARLYIDTSNNEAAARLLQAYEPEISGDAFSVSAGDKDQVALVAQTLLQHNLDIYLLQPKTNDLEQLFIDLTTVQS